MTDKIKLPWRRFGDELPAMGDTSPLLLIVLATYRFPMIGYLSDEEYSMLWVLGDGHASQWADEDDYWMYLEELETPHEKENGSKEETK